jgi:hypothetical protein
MKEIIVDGTVYTEHSEDSDLELLLLQHLGLDRVNDIQITLSDSDLLCLKSWLLRKTEDEVQPGNYSCIRFGIPGVDGGPMETVFARGKKKNGEALLWHDPLPWPVDWDEERSSVRGPSILEILKTENGIALQYDHIFAEFNEAQARHLLNLLNEIERKPFAELHQVPFQNGELSIGNYDQHFSFEFETQTPFASLSTSFSKEVIQSIASALDSAIDRAFAES